MTALWKPSREFLHEDIGLLLHEYGVEVVLFLSNFVFTWKYLCLALCIYACIISFMMNVGLREG